MRQMFRPPVKLPREQMSMAMLVSAAFLIAGYDLNILGLALPRIMPDLGMLESEQGQTIAIVRLGILLAFPLAALADRFGRKAILAVTIVGSGLFTLLTAFAQTPEQFLICQALVRVFGYAQDMIAIVMISEEVDDRARGWALGLLAAMGAAGAGTAAIIYAGVDVMFGGWRALYVIGALPLFLIAWLWRRLPETQRFTRLKESGAIKPAGLLSGVKGIFALFGAYPKRSAALSALVFVFALGSASAVIFTPTFLQTERGFSPGQVTLLVLIGGLLALAGNFVAGQLSDRFGRRTVLAAGGLMVAMGFGAFYAIDIVPVMLVGWIVGLFGFFAAEVVLSAYGAELFATAHRSSGSGLRTTMQIVGGAVGLLAKDYLYVLTGSHGLAIILLLPAVLVSLLIVFATLPETAGRTLEDISPDHPPPQSLH